MILDVLGEYCLFINIKGGHSEILYKWHLKLYHIALTFSILVEGGVLPLAALLWVALWKWLAVAEVEQPPVDCTVKTGEVLMDDQILETVMGIDTPELADLENDDETPSPRVITSKMVEVTLGDAINFFHATPITCR